MHITRNKLYAENCYIRESAQSLLPAVIPHPKKRTAKNKQS